MCGCAAMYAPAASLNLEGSCQREGVCRTSADRLVTQNHVTRMQQLLLPFACLSGVPIDTYVPGSWRLLLCSGQGVCFYAQVSAWLLCPAEGLAAMPRFVLGFPRRAQVRA